MTNPHRFLAMHNYHMSESKARKAVDQILSNLGLTVTSQSKVRLPNKETDHDYRVMVAEMRRTGYVKDLAELFDVRDPVFGGVFSLATTSSVMSLKVSFAGYEKEIQGPGRFYPTERELTEDVLFYREQVCEFSYENEFILTARYFRAYLISSVSIVEAYLNRYVLVAAIQPNIANSQAYLNLKNTINLEKKFELWLNLFAQTDISKLNGTIHWDHFQRLRKARNEMVHTDEPFFGASIKDMCAMLNYVKLGVGGLLKIIRELQMIPTLSFIDRLYTAPPIEFRSRS